MFMRNEWQSLRSALTQDDGAFSSCPLCSFPSGSVSTAQDCYSSSLMIHRFISHKQQTPLFCIAKLSREKEMGYLKALSCWSSVWLRPPGRDVVSNQITYMFLMILKHDLKSCSNNASMWIPVSNIQVAVKMCFLTLFSYTRSERFLTHREI